MFIVRDWLVFRKACSRGAGDVMVQPPAEDGAEWYPEIVTLESMQALFGEDVACRARFERLAKAGGVGAVIRSKEKWLAYGWVSFGAKAAPSHLPVSLVRRAGFWIHTCHTREECRGRGLYKRLLAFIVDNALVPHGRSQHVYIDTAPGNLPARRAIRAAGFVEAGRLRVLYLRLPRVRHPLFSWWFTSEGHPLLDGQH